MEQVFAALITAAASVVVALISSKAGERANANPRKPSVNRNEGTPRRNAKGWYFGLGLLMVWLVLSPALLHHDLGGINYFLIPVVVAVLSLAFPIPPLRAAWMSMAVYAANYVVGPLSNRLAGSIYDIKFFVPSRSGLLILFGLGFGGAALAALICYLRLRKKPMHETTSDNSAKDSRPEADPQPDQSLPGQLARLAAMRADGALTREEFDAAKRKLLSAP